MATLPDSPETLFLLSSEEAGLLFSLHSLAVKNDIAATESEELKVKKQEWLSRYEELTSLKESALSTRIENCQEPERMIPGLRGLTADKRKVIFFEASNFAPYFDLNVRHKNLTGLKKKAWGGEEAKKMRLSLVTLAKMVDPKEGNQLEKKLDEWDSAYSNALKEISGDNSFFKKSVLVVIAGVALAVTAGAAAPAIGAAIGGYMGLSGAAATSAGLAFLGGGAIAVGGGGMAVGTAFLIGGGAVLGLAGGVAAGNLMQLEASVVLTQLAKADLIISKILAKTPMCPSLVEHAIKQYGSQAKECQKAVARLREELTKLDGELKTKSEKTISELELSEKYYKAALLRLRKFQAEVLDLA